MTAVCTVLRLPFDDGVKLGAFVISVTKGNNAKGSVRKGNNMMGLGVMGGNFV